MKDDAERARKCLATVNQMPPTTSRTIFYPEETVLAAMLAFAQQPEGWVSLEKSALKVLLPPGSCEQEYLDGWVDGQTYLIGNIVVWSAMLDVAPIPGEEK